VSTDKPAKDGDRAISVAQLETLVDPRAEWAQIFRETWRIQREYFYDAKMHGANWQAVYDRYRPLVDHVAHRSDLAYLIATVGGELTVGHSYLIGTGDLPADDPVPVGLLGADFAIENGHYRIRKIYTGENPELQHLERTRNSIAEGDYILEVNGRPLAHRNLCAFEERRTADLIRQQDTVDEGPVLTVVPVASDQASDTRLD
jgi:tricorn protease